WRCYVCNDVHYGVAPPELCPTCKVLHAYVEITAEEARKLLGGGPDAAMAQPDFRAAIERFTVGNEFEVNPDADKVGLLLTGIFENEKNHGFKFCPCRLRTKDWEEDLKLICPCNFPIHETYKGVKDGECWCGLFIRRK
ncbi:MAG TPA: ferredoxin-thioredoxin reductase catalytic domain-containing protein, partial [Acidobacteriota bacterium]|nr:ferredoxin-thioredoxin reductase catalytic domain-containing protein [Acidobacteriota bacterium]